MRLILILFLLQFVLGCTNSQGDDLIDFSSGKKLIAPCFNIVEVTQDNQFILRGENLSYQYNKMDVSYVIDVGSSEDGSIAFTIFGKGVHFKGDTIWKLNRSSIDSIIVSRKFHSVFFLHDKIDSIDLETAYERVPIFSDWDSVFQAFKKPLLEHFFVSIRLFNNSEALIDSSSAKVVHEFCFVLTSNIEKNSRCTSFNGNLVLVWYARRSKKE